jgi:hypothetical protein
LELDNLDADGAGKFRIEPALQKFGQSFSLRHTFDEKNELHTIASS